MDGVVYDANLTGLLSSVTGLYFEVSLRFLCRSDVRSVLLITPCKSFVTNFSISSCCRNIVSGTFWFFGKPGFSKIFGRRKVYCNFYPIGAAKKCFIVPKISLRDPLVFLGIFVLKRFFFERWGKRFCFYCHDCSPKNFASQYERVRRATLWCLQFGLPQVSREAIRRVCLLSTKMFRNVP